MNAAERPGRRLARLLRHPIRTANFRMHQMSQPRVPYEIRLWADLQASLPRFAELSALKRLEQVGVCEHEIQDLTVNIESSSESIVLGEIFSRFGTDKHRNGYSPVYAGLLGDLRTKQCLLVEVGIGTNNIHLPSNMGALGMPGASLRAFSEYLGDASEIIGADIDRDILFEEPGIATFFVDQLSIPSLNDLMEQVVLRGGADLIVDDGLHRPVSCINTLLALLPSVKRGGYFLIEDQDPKMFGFWTLVLSLLPNDFDGKIIRTSPEIDIVVIQSRR